MRKKRNIRGYFTLIELLAVIGIASVVMALALPAFTRMVSGNKVDEAAGRLKLGLEQAQSLAATENRYVALLLPNGSDTVVDVAAAQKNRLGGYRPAFVERSGSTYTFDRWVDDHDWKNAPEQNIEAAILARVVDTAHIAALPQISSEVSTGEDAEIPSSDGKIGIAGCPAAVTGSYSGSSLMEIGSNPTGADSATLAVIFNPRGGIMNGSDLYFVVAAAKVEGTAVSYPAEDSLGPVDYRILMLHQYTGRVEFK